MLSLARALRLSRAGPFSGGALFSGGVPHRFVAEALAGVGAAPCVPQAGPGDLRA